MNELKCVLETPECVREFGVDQKCFQRASYLYCCTHNNLFRHKNQLLIYCMAAYLPCASSRASLSNSAHASRAIFAWPHLVNP
jgi:hypothetical protein